VWCECARAPEPMFAVRRPGGFDAIGLLGAVGLGLIAGLGARGFAWMLATAKRVTTTVPLTARILLATVASAGLVLAGRAATGRDLILGPGYDCIRWAAQPDRAFWLLMLVLVLRCLATSVPTAVGGSGGLFIPLVVAGALLGRAVGGLVGRFDDTMFL